MEGRVLGRGTGGTMKHRLENLAAANNLARIGSPHSKKKRRGRKRLQTGRGRQGASKKKRKCKTAKRRKRGRI